MAKMTAQEIQDLSEGLVQAMRKAGMFASAAASSGGSSSRSSKPSSPSPSGGIDERLGKDAKKSFNMFNRAQRTFVDMMMDSAKSSRSMGKRFRDLEEASDQLLNDNLDKIMVSMKGLSAKMTTSASNMQKFFNDQIQGLEEGDIRGMFDSIQKIGDALDDVKKGLEKFGGSFDKISAGIESSGLKAGDDVYKFMMESGQDFSAALSDTEKKILEKMMAGNDLTADEAKKFAEALGKHTADASNHLEKFTSSLKIQMAKTKVVEGSLDAFAKSLNITNISIMALFGVLAKGMWGLWNQFRAIAAGGMAGHWEEIVGQSIKLGISSEKLTEIFKQNASTVALVGGHEFTDRLNKAQNGLVELGLGLEEAAQGANGFHKNAIESGIDPRNTNAINKSMQEQTKAFAKLRSLTGVTAEEFNNLNQQLLENADNQTLMLRIAPQERAARFNELQGLRQEFVQRGLSAQAAQNMMNVMNQFQKNKLKDRLEGAARMQQLGGIMGMGAEGARAGELMRKRTRTKSEEAELAMLSANMKGASEQFGNQGMGFENAMDVMDDNMGQAAKGLLDASVQLKLAADKMARIDDATVGKEVENSKLSPEAQALVKTQDILKNALQTPLWLIVGSVAGILALLAKDSMMNMGKGVWDKLKGLTDRTPRLKASFGGIGEKLSSVTSKLGEVGKGLLERFKGGGMPRLTASFGKEGLMSGTKGIIGNFAKNLLPLLGKGLTQALSKFPMISIIITAISGLWQGIKDAFNSADIFGESVDWATWVLQKTTAFFSGILQGILTGLDFLSFGIFSGFFDSMKEGIDEFAHTLYNYVARTWLKFKKMIMKINPLSSKEDVAAVEAQEKALEENLKSSRKSTEETKKNTAANKESAEAAKNAATSVKDLSSEKYLGVTGGVDSVTVASLKSDVAASKINDPSSPAAQSASSGSKDSSNINKDSAASQSDATEKKDSSASSQNKQITLADIHKVLLDILKETTDGNEQTAEGLSKLKTGQGSKFNQIPRVGMLS